MTLPGFLGLGALKAGTTTVHALLSRHPDLALPVHVKELMFFDQRHARGVAWYEAHFAHAAGRLAGEISPSYLYDRQAPARAWALVPHARLLVVLRDPVERFVSQARFYAKEQGWRGDARDLLVEHPNAFERGLYGAQLRRWLDHFPRAALHVTLFEDLAADPGAAVRPVLRHLGVRDDVPLAADDEQHNASRAPRSQAVWTAGRRAARWLHDHDLSWVVDGARRLGLRDALLSRGRPEVRGLDDALRDELRQRYAPDLADAAALLDEPRLFAWTTPPTSARA